MIKLLPKTLERIRNHFREVGQPASVHFTRASEAMEDPFAGDEEASRRFQALFEVMYLEGREARLKAIAPTLKEDPALSEAAFSLAAAIAFADNEIKDEENDL